ncbi:MAG TPA: response regulator transcription factor [Sulfurimonas sp.]|nr:response regulator transcription factor [Sulfurimonas sp.]
MQVKLYHGLLRVSTKILLLEDDALFGETLADLLEDDGYETTLCVNGQDALSTIYEEKFDLYLLDVNVPLIDGLSLLRELRVSEDNTPAIFLTSHKDKETLQKAFVSGADDYLCKPFDNDELLLRLRALLKRSKPKEAIEVGELRHDITHKSISYKGNTLELSKKEYLLLVLFMKYVNATVTKELIYEELWNFNESGSDGAIRVYVNRLKQLLPELSIENIRGVGYKLVY